MNLDWLLAGIETEYGLLVEGRGADTQIDDSMALVRGYPGPCFVGWDYRYESPRNDLRGFRLERLEVDPEDAKYDAERPPRPDSDVRSDRVLPNGARFYNDHGHPEYSTPESHSLDRLALLDREGERIVHQAGRAYARAIGAEVRLFKNNTDFHGASYGTHESYLAPRSLGFEGLFAAVLPMLVARQILCGAGKAGEFAGPATRALGAIGIGDRTAPFQISQRADFLVEPANAETLYRRPVFNTRDEPHADPREWIRLHVICGDANRIPSATRRKVGLVQIAIALAAIGQAPVWRLRDPVDAFKRISRAGGVWVATDEDDWARATLGPESPLAIELEGGSWTTAEQVLESYLAAGERFLELDPAAPGIRQELGQLVVECRSLLDDMKGCRERFRRHVDWAAKASLMSQYVEAEGIEWGNPALQALDLEYADVDPENGLFAGLVQLGEVDAAIGSEESASAEYNRAFARGLATTKFASHLAGGTWAALTFDLDDRLVEVHLDPTKRYGPELADIDDVRTFVTRLQEIAP